MMMDDDGWEENAELLSKNDNRRHMRRATLMVEEGGIIRYLDGPITLLERINDVP